MLSQRRAMPGVRPSRRHSCRPMAWQATGGTYHVVGGKADPKLLSSDPTIAALTVTRPSENQELLQKMSAGISPDDFEEKKNKMRAGPFEFLRGSAKFFYRDMQQQGVVMNSSFYVPKARTWLTGDMHMANAGRFKYAKSDKSIVFDVNDFDESFVGSYLYDVYRLAASVALVARDGANGLEGENDSTSKYVRRFASSYLDQIKALGNDGNKDKGKVNRDPLNASGAGSGPIFKLLGKDPSDKYIEGDQLQAPEDDPGSIKPVYPSSVVDAVRAAVGDYALTTDKWAELGDEEGQQYFSVLDVKRRLDAGTGSLGTTRFYALIAGSDDSGRLVLDIKKQGLPAWFDYVSADEMKVAYGDLGGGAEREGARVVQAYKKMVSYGPDPHLGVLTLSGFGVDYLDGVYSVRVRSPWKKALKLVLADKNPLYLEKGDMELLAEQYGTLLANAHDRASDNTNGTPPDFAGLLWPVLKGQQDAFIDSVENVGCAYAQQAKVDLALTLG